MGTFNDFAEIHQKRSAVPVCDCVLDEIESILRHGGVTTVRIQLYTCWRLMDTDPVVAAAVAGHVYQCAAEAGYTVAGTLNEAVDMLLDNESHIEIPLDDAIRLARTSRDIAAACALAALEIEHQ